jgi:3-oxo-4-pregnene-20-carboxyl-CoA dehydrogenase beta subunit
MSDARSDDTLALFRESVRGLLERRWPAERALELAADPAAVARMWDEAVAQGWVDPGAAGADAGSGAGTAALLVVVEELGRAACPLPLVDTALVAAPALAAAPPGVAPPPHLPPPALAVALGDAGGERGGGAVEVRDAGNGAAVSGRVRFVEGLPLARRLLVVGHPGPQVALVDLDAPRVTVTATPGLAVPAQADITVGAVSAAAWEVGDATVAEMARLGRLGCSARALGAATRAFDLALEHARTRQQFGSPIGRFQAIQHRLADCGILLDATRLLIDRAGRSRDQGRAGWPDDAAAAAAFAGPSLRRVAREAQHVLAGVGYIEEHEAPRHFRRVHADTLRYGGAAAGRAGLAGALLDR